MKNKETGDMALINFPDTSEIVSLTKDSLQINVKGKLYVCVRQTKVMTISGSETDSKVIDVSAQELQEKAERAEHLKEVYEQSKEEE